MKKINTINQKGFTLVELLAVITVLSVIMTIVIYSATNIIKKTKEKGYLTTINNIEEEADDFATENLSDFSWINSFDNKYQYLCVSVQKLIDSGFFKYDILNSYVSENRKVLKEDNIYLERDNNTKTITKNKLILDEDYSYLCDIITTGSIEITVLPSDWAREKTVTINYILNNPNNISDYKYSYNLYEETNISNIFSKNTERLTLTVEKNGDIHTKINTSSGGELVTKTATIDKIDRVNPYGSIEDNGSNIKLNMNDDHSGLSKYYFGKTNPNTNTVNWIDIEEHKQEVATDNNPATGNNKPIPKEDEDNKIINNIVIDTTISDSGTWYLGIEDNVGNKTVISKEIEKIEMYTITYKSNGGTGTMSSTSCSYGSTCSISSNTFTRKGYNFAGWTTNSNGTDDGYNWTNWSGTWNFQNGQKGIKNNTLTLYARWTGKTYTITYKANGGYSSIANENKSYCPTQSSENHDVKGTMTTQQCTYGASCTLKNNAYERQCHNFIGWTTNTDTESVDYTKTNMGSSDSDKFYENKDTFTYNIADNITLYAVWESNHTYTAVGNQVHKTTGTYTCGYGHTHSYVRYCSVCQMSAKNYNLCYKPQYEKDQANKFCPCGTDAANTTFDDHYQFNSSGNKLDVMPYNGKVDELVKGFGGILSNQQFDKIYSGNVAPVICDEHDAYTITLNKQSGVNGTSKIYGVYISSYKIDGKYRYKLYLELSSDGVYSKQITSHENPITPPKRTGYIFEGYYTEKNGKGTQIINSSGYLIQKSSNEMYKNNITLYAKWTKK